MLMSEKLVSSEVDLSEPLLNSTVARDQSVSLLEVLSLVLQIGKLVSKFLSLTK